MFTKTQVEYLILGLLYNAARETQRAEWEKHGRLYQSPMLNDAVNEIDSFLSWCERSGKVDEWIRFMW